VPSNAVTISALVLVYNRERALARTLDELAKLPLIARVVVVDNASTDGSASAAEGRPDTKVVRLGVNTGVAAFARGIGEIETPFVLVLDDDAWPDAGSLSAAHALLSADDSLAAVALSPVHPESKVREWPRLRSRSLESPFMGCGNLVRVSDWHAAGGYEGKFFLYRNDTDLALAFAALGRGVAFDPSWIVWHDSPAAGRKTERWLHLATRNWAWMARRHARGVWLVIGLVAAFAHALREAGLSLRRVRAALRGVRQGLFTPAPLLPADVPRTGEGFRRLVRAKLGCPGFAGSNVEVHRLHHDGSHIGGA